MRRLECFNECCKGGYQNTHDYVSWKIIDGIMYFQCSKEKEDWLKNIDIRLVNSGFGFIHKGFSDAYIAIYRTIMQNPAKAYCGYSHGAVIAAMASALTEKKAIVFGCPNFLFMPSKENQDKFNQVEFIQNPRDIVANGIFWMKKGVDVVMLSGHAWRGGIPLLEWFSGHSPNEYRQRISNV